MSRSGTSARLAPVRRDPAAGRRGRTRGEKTAPYRRRVEAYDLVHRDKPYGAEARTVRRLVRRFGPAHPRTLLDVACGTGRHLEQFRRWFDCAGIDANAAMLRRARARLPGVPLFRGDMGSFDLGRRFDVVTCLFSAIGYVRTVRGLRRAVRSMARHLAPGGVLLVEPWLEPGIFQDGRVDALEARGDGLVVLRMNDCRLYRGRSVMDFHYLIGSRGSVEHLLERHDCGLFSRQTMEAAFRDAGLEPRFLAQGPFSGRGIYVAVPAGPGRG